MNLEEQILYTETEQQKLESNKLIAEFMGAEVQQPYSEIEGLSGLMFYYPKDTSPDIFRNLPLSAIKYNSSFAWLMPVIDKIEALYEGNVSITISGVRCHLSLIMGTRYPIATDFIEDIPQCYSGSCDSKIIAVYTTVVEFIKWYNQNK